MSGFEPKNVTGDKLKHYATLASTLGRDRSVISDALRVAADQYDADAAITREDMAQADKDGDGANLASLRRLADGFARQAEEVRTILWYLDQAPE